MKKLPQLLSGLLALQVLLAGGLLWLNTAGAPVPAQPLLAQADAVDKLLITEGGSTTTLIKRAGQWQLPGLDNLPADAAKVDAALQLLNQRQTRYPVATQANSHTRFAVHESNAERRLQLFAGEQPLANLILGNSPGLRQLHVRRANDKPVFAVQLNHGDFPAEASQWLDRALLAVNAPVEIAGKDFTLRKQQDQWQLANDEQAAVDTAKTGALASALSNLRVQSVADAVAFEQPLELQVTSAGQPQPVRFLLVERDGRYYIKRNDIDSVFEISAYDYRRLHIGARTELLAAATDTDATKSDAGDNNS